MTIQVDRAIAGSTGAGDSRRRRHAAALLPVLLLAPFVAVATDAWLGLKVRAEREGFFLNPVLKRVVITGSQVDSPAARAGVQPDDLLLSINGTRIAGARANALSAVLDELAVGDRVILQVERAGSGVVTLTLVAEALPESR